MSKTPDVMILTDLDDSLFSTLRKIPENQRHSATVAARAADSASGKDSFMTLNQLAMVQWFDLSRCVPVTARGTEAYSRVMLRFDGPAAIVANGAVMLDNDGTVNQAWAENVNAVLQPLQDRILQLPDILQQLASQRCLNIRSWAVMEPSCGAVYAVAKSNDSVSGQGLEGLMEDMKVYFQANGHDSIENWRFHINGNNLSLTPVGIGKAIAVDYLLKNLRKKKAVLAIGVGDSKSDLEFMQLCDAWLTPARSQIDLMLS